MAALHFLLPTGDSRSGRRSFDSKHLPSPARRGSRRHPNSPPGPGAAPHPAPPASRSATPTGPKPALCAARAHRDSKGSDCLWNPYGRGGTPTRRQALGRLPTPPPLPENLLLRLHRKLPFVPPASTQEVSESENRPATRGTAHSEV